MREIVNVREIPLNAVIYAVSLRFLALEIMAKKATKGKEKLTAEVKS